MEITINGNFAGNVIEHVESGSTIIGIDKRIQGFDWTSKEQMDLMVQELRKLKETLSQEQGKENVCANIDEAIVAIQEKNESKFIGALKCIGRECTNVAEGIIGSIIATIIMKGDSL